MSVRDTIAAMLREAEKHKGRPTETQAAVVTALGVIALQLGRIADALERATENPDERERMDAEIIAFVDALPLTYEQKRALAHNEQTNIHHFRDRLLAALRAPNEREGE